MNTPIELHPRYYQDNFEQLCGTVWLQYEDLLAEREKEFYHCYQDAGPLARCLFIRLVSRRGPLFRREQLDYPELENLDAALSNGIEAGLLKAVDKPEPEALLHLLRKGELLEIYAGPLSGIKGQRKSELEAHLLENLADDALRSAWQDWREPDAVMLEVSFRECVELFQLLFE